MNKLIGMFFLAGLLLFSACGQQGGNANLRNDLDSVSYAIGVSVGKSLESGGMEELNYEALKAGFQAVLEKEDLKIDAMAANNLINEYMRGLHVKMAEKNLEEGRTFLEENKAKEGVETTESGLQYIVLQEGTGAMPTAEDKVKVHYTGTLTDGTVFDSSVERGEPAEFYLNRVIPGWTEALQMMKVGSKWKIFVPSELGYGSNPRPGGAIKPNQVLIFEVELLDIVEDNSAKPEGE